MIDDKPKQLGELKIGPQTLEDIIGLVYPKILSDTNSGLKDKGKLIGFAGEELTEIYVKKYMPGIEVVFRKDLVEWIKSHPQFSHILQDKRVLLDNNGSGFDVVIVNALDKVYLLVQIKVRTSIWHFANTRRHSLKNVGQQSGSGQIAYGIAENDVLIVISPSERISEEDDLNTYLLSDLEYTAFFFKDLESPKTPGFCVTSIGDKLCSRIGHSVEYVLSSLFKI